MFIFFVFLYGLYDNLIKSSQYNIKNIIKTNVGDNVAILSKLGYYNYNYNLIKTKILSDCVNYIIFCENPNYTLLPKSPCNVLKSNNEFFPNIFSSYKDYCNKNNKLIGDTTVNEIINFIKKDETFIKIQKNNDEIFRRVIMLSKFLYDCDNDRLIDALTNEEIKTLHT